MEEDEPDADWRRSVASRDASRRPDVRHPSSKCSGAVSSGDQPAQAQIHPQVQQDPPAVNNQIQHPPQAAAAASATGTQSLAVIAVLLGATNILLTVLVLMVVVVSAN